MLSILINHIVVNIGVRKIFVGLFFWHLQVLQRSQGLGTIMTYIFLKKKIKYN